MLHSKFGRLSAAELELLHQQLQMRIVQTMSEIDHMQTPNVRRLAVLGSRLEHASLDLLEIEAEVINRDLLDSLPDATGPEQLEQLMQFIQ